MTARKSGIARPSVFEWWLAHFLVPLAGWLVLLVLVVRLHLDQKTADLIFRLEGYAWSLRDAPITQLWLHDRIKLVLVGVFIALVCFAIAAPFVERLRRFARGLAYLVTAMLVAALTVSSIKHFSGIYCPWDVSRYGGSHAAAIFRGIWPVGEGGGRCFPAGHATVGYAWLALYFFCDAWFPAIRWRALAFGLGAGIVLGLAQELRGAHFLSHDLWSLGICWFTAVLMARVFKLPVTLNETGVE